VFSTLRERVCTLLGDQSSTLKDKVHLQEQRHVKETGANPTIVNYNVSAVKIFNATSSLVYSFYQGKTLQPTTALAL
jgi:hypothetical protein